MASPKSSLACLKHLHFRLMAQTQIRQNLCEQILHALVYLLLPLLLVPPRGPWMLATSLWDSFKVPPENFPTPGTSTPRCLRTFLSGFEEAFSNMMPFSFASLRRLASFDSAFFVMPIRCDLGILSCVKTDALAPSACNLISNAICLSLLAFRDALDFSSKCDSLSSR